MYLLGIASLLPLQPVCSVSYNARGAAVTDIVSTKEAILDTRQSVHMAGWLGSALLYSSDSAQLYISYNQESPSSAAMDPKPHEARARVSWDQRIDPYTYAGSNLTSSSGTQSGPSNSRRAMPDTRQRGMWASHCLV